jgi:hypothetical protein
MSTAVTDTRINDLDLDYRTAAKHTVFARRSNGALLVANDLIAMCTPKDRVNDEAAIMMNTMNALCWR